MEQEICPKQVNHNLDKAKVITDKLTIPIYLSVQRPTMKFTFTKRRGKIVSKKDSLLFRLI